MPDMQRSVNVLLLFADEDEEWRVILLNHLGSLKSEGRIALWDSHQILPGTDRAVAVEQHLKSASVILLLVSAACLTSYDREIEQALLREMSGDVLVVPILLHPVDWQNTRLSHLQPLPSNGEPVTMWPNQDAAFVEVVAGIRRTLPEVEHLATSAHPPMFPRIWNIPYPRNPVFTGREEILKRIRTQLQKGLAMALSQAQAISGLGGIGKTQIALEYAYQHRQDYQAVLWVLADTRESLISGYIAVAGLLKLPEKDIQEQQIVIQAVKNWLQIQSSWLLILDNADDLGMVREFVPTIFGGHILLTTRAQSMGRLAKCIEVEMMNQDVGALFLLRRVGLIDENASLETASSSDRAIARSTTQELGGLPLALDQAGSFIEETQCSLIDFLNLYRTRRAELLNARGGLIDDHREPVATTWSISFKNIEEKNPAAADLLRLCAFLHTDAIPEQMIVQGAEHLGPRLQEIAADPLRLNVAIAVLRTHSLVQRDSGASTLSIHRLVQAVVRDAMTEQERMQWQQYISQMLNAVFPEVTLPQEWNQRERLTPHVLMYASVTVDQTDDQELANVLRKTADYLRAHAHFEQAEPLYLRSLSIWEQVLGPEYPAVAELLNRLAHLYAAQRKHAQAEPLYQRALCIWEQTLGPEHAAVGAPLNGLAHLYTEQGKYKQAELLYQRALHIWEQTLGPEHWQVATVLNGLTHLYVVQSKYEQAEVLCQRALQILEQTKGPGHHNVATTLNGLAHLYVVQGKYEQAEALYQRALQILEQTRGPEHPHMARTLNGLANLYKEQGRYAEAESLYLRALRIGEWAWGVDNPRTENIRQGYTSLLRKIGREKKETSLET